MAACPFQVITTLPDADAGNDDNNTNGNRSGRVPHKAPEAIEMRFKDEKTGKVKTLGWRWLHNEAPIVQDKDNGPLYPMVCVCQVGAGPRLMGAIKQSPEGFGSGCANKICSWNVSRTVLHRLVNFGLANERGVPTPYMRLLVCPVTQMPLLSFSVVKNSGGRMAARCGYTQPGEESHRCPTVSMTQLMLTEVEAERELILLHDEKYAITPEWQSVVQHRSGMAFFLKKEYCNKLWDSFIHDIVGTHVAAASKVEAACEQLEEKQRGAVKTKKERSKVVAATAAAPKLGVKERTKAAAAPAKRAVAPKKKVAAPPPPPPPPSTPAVEDDEEDVDAEDVEQIADSDGDTASDGDDDMVDGAEEEDE